MNINLGTGLAPVIGAALLAAGGAQAVNANMAGSDVNPQMTERFLEMAEEKLDDDSKTLDQLVNEHRGISDTSLEEQEWCLANAVYFEARGESLEGQLAVADVVINRTESDAYPDNWCDVIKQHRQFSFVQDRRFPRITESQPWETAKAVARIAVENKRDIVRGEVLWYHADYVAPIWRHNLNEVTKVGVHIFYEA